MYAVRDAITIKADGSQSVSRQQYILYLRRFVCQQTDLSPENFAVAFLFK